MTKLLIYNYNNFNGTKDEENNYIGDGDGDTNKDVSSLVYISLFSLSLRFQDLKIPFCASPKYLQRATFLKEVMIELQK